MDVFKNNNRHLKMTGGRVEKGHGHIQEAFWLLEKGPLRYSEVMMPS
jgi:hypothetical protein